MEHRIIPLSVVIPTINRHKCLVDTVQSLCSGSYVPSQIIIVDQSSEPITCDSFSNISGVLIEVIHLTIASTTHARNVGIGKAQEELILFCDDDILVNESSVEKTYTRISEQQIALVAGIHDKANANYSGRKKNLLRIC